MRHLLHNLKGLCQITKASNIDRICKDTRYVFSILHIALSHCQPAGTLVHSESPIFFAGLVSIPGGTITIPACNKWAVQQLSRK